MRAPIRTLAAAAAICVIAGGMVATPATAADGGLETSWSSSGVRALPWSFGPVRATTDIAATTGGQLLLVGSNVSGLGCVTRLTASGSLDASFRSTPGLVGSVCDLDNGHAGSLQAVQTTAGGGLVSAAVTTSNRFVARIDAQGVVEWVNEIPGNYTGTGGRILDVAPLSDGRTALLETHDSGGTGWVSLFEESGSFLGEWEVTAFDATHAFLPQQILPGPSGTVVLVGELDRDQGAVTAALRTRQDGSRDTTFSSDGFSDGPASRSTYAGRGAIGPGGTIVLAAVSDAEVNVRRLTATGAIDPAFRASGASATLPTGTDGIGEVVPRPDGRVFLAFHGEPGSTAVHVARLTAAGNLDTTFSGDGYATYDAGAGTVRESISAALAPQGDLYVLSGDPAGAAEPAVVLIDGTNDTKPPVPAMTRPTSTWTLSRSVPLSWTASDVSPVVSTDVRTRRASYRGSLPAASTALATGTTARARTLTGIAGGTTLCASTRARDVWGYQSAWSAERCTSVPLTPAQLTRGKGVKNKASAGTYDGRVLKATKKGATITRKGVQTKRITLVATTCATCGKVKVYFGSKRLKTVSLTSSKKRKKVVIAVAAFGSVRKGTVRIKVASSGKKVLVEGLGVSKV